MITLTKVEMFPSKIHWGSNTVIEKNTSTRNMKIFYNQWLLLGLSLGKFLLRQFLLVHNRLRQSFYCCTLTLFRMGAPKSPPPPTSFSRVTSTNVGFGPKNFLTFSFNPFATLVQNFKFVPSASPKLLNLNHPSKKVIFLVKSL